MPTGATRLGLLLSSAYSFCVANKQAVLFGALIFGTVSALLLGSVQHKADRGIGSMMQEMGMDVERMEELGTRMQAGDESAAAEMEALVNARFGDMTDDEQAQMGMNMGLKALRFAAPIIGVSFIVSILVSVASGAYFLLLALSAQKNAPTLFGKVPGLFLPLLGVWVWSFLRSFVWIPVLGLIPGIILGPRFALAPVILIQEKKGVMESVSSSYDRTVGYWGKIVGNMIVAALCMWLVGIVCAIIAGILGAFSVWLGVWFTAVAKMVVMAYLVVFGTQLSLTILANPMAVVPAKKK